ncbi:MAG TPA: twin-arginine translocation signal domain-containing protein [Desulfobacterales bacterium]|nr:twin-arginine translocation signal domain-containing protein [Desulfobacterales bacterium]
MMSRRDVLKGVAVGTAAFAISKLPGATAIASEPEGHGEKKVVSPQEAIARLSKGNQRYVSMNRLSDPGVGPDARAPLTEGQWPYATILCCSDSRVPPELIFDEGLGRLFIVRVAGNMIAPALLGSIEYASLHSTSRLIVVMGHESCGAVGATVKVAENPGAKETPGINDIINRLMPAVLKAQKETGFHGKKLVEAASKENVRMTVKQIADESEPLRKMQDRGELKVVGGYYLLSTGEVSIWA